MLMAGDLCHPKAMEIVLKKSEEKDLSLGISNVFLIQLKRFVFQDSDAEERKRPLYCHNESMTKARRLLHQNFQETPVETFHNWKY